MHWPVQNTRQEVEQDRIQCREFTDAERSVSERPVFTPTMDTDADDSDFSVQCSQTPRTPDAERSVFIDAEDSSDDFAKLNHL